MLHRRVGAIVWQRLDDTEARAAIGAVGKGIAIASIVPVENLAQAVSTRRDIRQDNGGLWPSKLTAAYGKRCITDRRKPRRLAALDMRLRWQLAWQADQELLED
jgi:hypothetical protein